MIENFKVIMRILAIFITTMWKIWTKIFIVHAIKAICLIIKLKYFSRKKKKFFLKKLSNINFNLPSLVTFAVIELTKFKLLEK